MSEETTYTLRFFKTALQDLRSAKRSSAKYGQSVKRQFVSDANKAFSLIEFNPKGFRVRYDEDRVLRIGRSPFLIYYSIEGKTVLIKGIIDGRRDPNDIESDIKSRE